MGYLSQHALSIAIIIALFFSYKALKLTRADYPTAWLIMAPFLKVCIAASFVWLFASILLHL